MKSRTLMCITAVTLFGALVVPVQLSAQQHHHYMLVDMGTFGGPTSGVNEPSFGIDASRTLNAREMVGVSATSIPTTATSNPFDCGAFVNHAFVRRMRMVIDLGTLPGVNNCSGTNAINSDRKSVV